MNYEHHIWLFLLLPMRHLNFDKVPDGMGRFPFKVPAVMRSQMVCCTYFFSGYTR